jgi:transcriptional regulator with XRE-family HTH domain
MIGSTVMAEETNVHDRLVIALGQVLQEHRNLLKLSQSQLAQSSDFHRSYISDVERGYRNISLKNLNRLAQALKVPASNLLSLAEKRSHSI